MKKVKKSHLSDIQKFALNQFSSDQCKEAIKLLNARIKAINVSGKKTYLDKGIIELNLSPFSYNALLNQGLRTIGDVIGHGIEKIYWIRGAGKKLSKEIREAIYNDLPFEILKDYTVNRASLLHSRITNKDDYELYKEMLDFYMKRANESGELKRLPQAEMEKVNELSAHLQDYERHLEFYVNPRYKRQLNA